MAENSHISWTDNTHNEWIGCTKVSAGCDNCYAEREQDHRYGRAKWGKGNARYLTSESNRRKPFAWDRQAEKEGRRIKVFTASLSDVFDEEVSDEWRDALFETIRNTPNLDWLVLTKRLAKMLRYVGSLPPAFIPPNVWWGCSVEDQDTANQRIPELLKMRRLVGDAPLWLSVEPLIGPMNIEEIVYRDAVICPLTGEWVPHTKSPVHGGTIAWVVVGGESGPSARPMHPDWARSLRDQCVAAGVPFHFKQWGEWTDYTHAGAQGWEFTQESEGKRYGVLTYPDGSKSAARFETRYPWRNPEAHDTIGPCMVRVGKKAAGRTFDGREWDEFPRGVA